MDENGTAARGPLRVDPEEILKILLHREPISRADLARESGLSKAAVTNLVQEFRSLGIVEDNIPTQSQRGRNVMGIQLDIADFYMVAVRINRYQLSLRLYAGGGTTISTEETPLATETKIDELLETIISGIARLVSGRDQSRFLGIVIVSLGWLFESEGRIMIHTDGFSELGKVDIRARIAAEFPAVPVLLEHDAKTSALAEYSDYVKEYGKGPSCLLNVVAGIGFGGGILIDGKIFRGSRGVAGEIGHLGINFNSALHARDVEATEFRGLFEDYASPRALPEHVATRLLDFPDSPLTEDSTPAEIYAAYEARDPLATWAVHRTCRLLAYGLAGLVFVLNPDVIILGDQFPQSASVLRRIKVHLAEYLPSILAENVELTLSSRGSDGVLFGSYLLLIQWYLDENLLYRTIRRANGAGEESLAVP